MTADSFDPYRTPSLPQGPSGPAPTRTGRPGLLTTLCVLCIVLGALGLFNSIFGTFGLIAGRQFQQAMMKSQSSAPGISPEIKEAQENMQNEMYAIQEKYLVAIAVGLVLRFVASLLLVSGGVGALSLREWGRRVLIAACAVAAPFVLLDAILQSMITMENMTVMNSYMEVMMNEVQGKASPENVEGFVRGMFGAIKVVTIVLTNLLALAKLGLYCFGLVYLQRESIRNLYKQRDQQPLIASLS
jgi:hypothetical protein